MSRNSALLLTALAAIAAPAFADAPPGLRPWPEHPAAAAAQPGPVATPDSDDRDVITSTSKGKVTIRGRTIAYSVQSGGLVLRRPDGKPYHRLSYVAYTADGPRAANRPITFISDGGPGGPAVWMNLAAWGPKRFDLPANTVAGGGPYHLSDNPYSLLDTSDVVFIDAPGSGFSKAIGDGSLEDYNGVEKDAMAYKRFIERYLGIAGRWNSPKFLIGESYSGIRDAMLASLLQQDFIELTGVVAMSTIMDTSRLALNFPSSGKGPDEWYVGTLPTFAMSAQALGKAGQGETPEAWAEKARRFTRDSYAAALMQGDALPATARAEMIAQMSALTGLSADFIDKANLRVSPFQFRKEIIRDQGLMTGRFDATTRGVDVDATGNEPNYDPSWANGNGAYRAAYLDYLTTELHMKSTDGFRMSADNIPDGSFDWSNTPRSSGSGNLPNMKSSIVGNHLGEVARENPRLRIFWAGGYYDLATPFFASEIDASHFGLGARYHEVVTYRNYPGGHLFYYDGTRMKALSEDVKAFYAKALDANAR